LTALLLAALLDLRLTSSLVGLRIQSALHNDGAEPVAVVVSDRCRGPLFTLVVDNVARPFATTGRRCPLPAPVTHTIAPGGAWAALSDTLDGREHHVAVTFRELRAPMLHVPVVPRFELVLHAAAHVRPGQPVDVEIAHVNHSPDDVSVPTCGEDRLLVDGKEAPLAGGPECRPEPRTLAPRGSLVTRGRLTLAPGRHFVRARWHDAQSQDAIVDVGE
jgi:hypothetical protein